MLFKIASIHASLFTSVFLCGCASTSEPTVLPPITKIQKLSSAVELSFVRFESKDRVVFVMANNTSNTVNWSGYVGRPWYRLRYNDAKGWHEHRVGWFCGVGLESRQLSPGDTTAFHVDLPKGNYTTFQVGQDYHINQDKTELTIWSLPFTAPK